MKIQQFEFFLKIAEMESFSATADELFITQSSLSKQMQSLEKELGVTLFNRSKKAISLTNKGVILYRQATKFLEQYHQMLAELNPNNNVLYLGVLPVIAHYGITAMISDFTMQNPALKIEMEEADNMMLRKGLDEGRYNFAFMRIFKPEEYHTLTICTDELVLLVPAFHPQADIKFVPLKTFADENFIFLNKGTQLYESSVQSCRNAGFSPHIYYIGSSGESIVRLVQSGAGIAIIMDHVAQNLKNDQLSVLHFEETVKSEMVLAMAKDHSISYLNKFFWKFMRQKLEK